MLSKTKLSVVDSVLNYSCVHVHVIHHDFSLILYVVYTNYNIKL